MRWPVDRRRRCMGLMRGILVCPPVAKDYNKLDNIRSEIELAQNEGQEMMRDKHLNAETRRRRIKGIHQRLTQLLVVRFGLINSAVVRWC